MPSAPPICAPRLWQSPSEHDRWSAWCVTRTPASGSRARYPTAPRRVWRLPTARAAARALGSRGTGAQRRSCRERTTPVRRDPQRDDRRHASRGRCVAAGSAIGLLLAFYLALLGRGVLPVVLASGLISFLLGHLRPRQAYARLILVPASRARPPRLRSLPRRPLLTLLLSRSWLVQRGRGYALGVALRLVAVASSSRGCCGGSGRSGVRGAAAGDGVERA